MNYKPSHLINKSNNLSPIEIRSFLSTNSKGQGHQGIYDSAFNDDSQLKEIVMKQNFLISKGLMDPLQYFPSVPITSLEDKDLDSRILKAIKLPESNIQNKESTFQKVN